MIILDTLKNDDPNVRRVGESWMRCSLKTYLRYVPSGCSVSSDPDLV